MPSDEKQIGKVEVRVQTEERIYAINKLASAIETLAQALNSSPHVYVQNCTIQGSPGVSIDTEAKITRSEIITDESREEIE